jgi:hypothetical protein
MRAMFGSAAENAPLSAIGAGLVWCLGSGVLEGS